MPKLREFSYSHGNVPNSLHNRQPTTEPLHLLLKTTREPPVRRVQIKKSCPANSTTLILMTTPAHHPVAWGPLESTVCQD